MSLVNNMLRDLDQRRKESDSPSGAVSLMPAADYPSSGKRNLLPFVMLGLLLACAAAWYFWAQLKFASDEQQLDIQVQPQLVNLDVATEAPVPIVEVEQTLSLAAASIESQPDPIGSVNDELEQPEIQSSTIERSEEQLTQRNTVADRGLEPVKLPVEPGEEVIRQPEIVKIETPVEVRDEAVIPDELVEDADPTLVRNGVSESIKQAPEFTIEQQDTIAVQDALQLVAKGQTEEAYLVLEKHIASNRFAHQSRETYAKLLMSQGGVQQAYVLVEEGLVLAANHSGFKKVKARLLMARGQIKDAAEVLIHRAPNVAEDTEYHDLLASAQLSSKDYEGAAISYRGLVEIDPSQGKWWYGLAASQDQLGNANMASQAYRQAIQYSNLSANLRRRSQDRLSALNP